MWTGLSLLFVIFAIEIFVQIEQHIGASNLRQVIANLHAAGKSTTIDDLRAKSPAIDAHLQNEWNAWSTRLYVLKTTPLMPIPYKEWGDWIAGKASNPPDGILEDLNNHRSLMDDARLLLRNESLVISSYALLIGEFPADKKAMDESDWTTLSPKIPNLLAIRMLAEWLERDALLSSYPKDDLSDLDRLIHSLSRPVLIVDAMIALVVEDIRNRAYLELAVAGRLPHSLRENWLAEHSHEKELVADGLRGERVLLAPLRIAHLSGYVPVLGDDYGLSDGHLLTWPMGLNDFAVEIDLTARFEDVLREKMIAQFLKLNDVEGKIQSIVGFAKMLPFLFSHGLDGEANHRLARLAVRILAVTKNGSSLPSSQGEIVDLIGKDIEFDPGFDCLKLRYDHVAPDRFSLSVDPRGPFPPFYDRGTKILDHAAYKKSNNSMIINKLYVEIPVKTTGKSGSEKSPQHDDL